MRALGKHVANQVFAVLLLFGSASAEAEKAEALLNGLPLSFEANAGQFDPQVQFLARAHGKRLFLVREGMVLVLDPSRAPYDVQAIVRINFNDGSKRSSFEGVDRLAAITNYFRSGQSIADVPNFLRVRQREVYPGVDVLYYGNQGRLEYDFIVAPGADPKRISLRISGHDALRITEAGDLVLTTIAGELVMKRPAAYQERDGERLDVPVRYTVKGSEVKFELAAHDRDSRLIIDPLLAYSSFLANEGAIASAIALDAAGNIYVTGSTYTTDFPLVGAFQTKLLGDSDGFVTKINANGTARVYSTYIGGRNGSTTPGGIAVDSAGSAYIAGETTSTAYPVTSGAYRTSAGSSTSGFATKFSPQGNALAYSTFIPGGPASAIALTPAGNAVITGRAEFGVFTTTPGVVQPNSAGGVDAYVLQLNAAGTAAVYSTRLGGLGENFGSGIALDSFGNVYVTGTTKSSNFPLVNPFQSTLQGTQDAFVAKLNANATELIYSTYLGGSLKDSGNAIALDAQGNAYIGGMTYSLDFPVHRAFQSVKAYTGQGHQLINQAFITKLAPSGQALVYSSYLGGAACVGIEPCGVNVDVEVARAIAVDPAGTAYLAGLTRSLFFPQVDPIQSRPPVYGNSIPFVARVQDRENATLLYSVALGQKSSDGYWANSEARGIAVDAAGNVYAAGYVVANFPVTPGALSVAVAPAGCCLHVGVVFKLSPGAFPTTLSASNSYPTSSDPVTLTAVVTSAVPGGQVTFFENGNSIATVSVSNGIASYTTVFNAGVRELTAVYSADNKMSRPLFLPVKQAVSN